MFESERRKWEEMRFFVPAPEFILKPQVWLYLNENIGNKFSIYKLDNNILIFYASIQLSLASKPVAGLDAKQSFDSTAFWRKKSWSLHVGTPFGSSLHCRIA
jgi:hypothetical protein